MSGESPVIVVDVLNGLLEAELNSIFRFVEEGSPYVGEASVELRRELHAMALASREQAGQLYRQIESLGGTPVARSVQPQEQYLAYLSLRFLLPKLAEAKKLMVKRYENAIKALGKGPAPVMELLKRQLASHRGDLQILERATGQVLGQISGAEEPPP